MSLCLSYAYLQENDAEFKRGVAILASPQKDKILLRWAPNHHILWKKANAMQDSLASDYSWLCVSAQALYGKEFEMIDEKQNPMMQMVYKTF